MCWTPLYANKHKYMIPRYDFGFLISFGIYNWKKDRDRVCGSK